MTMELEYPAWPPGLTDATPLPYAYWRVMHVTDGRRSIDKLAGALALPEPQVRQVQQDVRRWLERAAVREQPLSEAAEQTLRQALISVMGPMGELMIDDALDDLPEHAPLSTLLTSLNSQLSDAHSQTLARLLRSKGIA